MGNAGKSEKRPLFSKGKRRAFFMRKLITFNVMQCIALGRFSS
jgi:hypothetical protein